jgi:succinyl-diaminopimelate desuccinylase
MSADALTDRLADLTLALCRIPSETGHEAAICDHMVAWAARHLPPEQIVRHGHSLVLGRPDAKGRPVIALVGHLDTVPPHAEDPPPGRDGDKLTALGSSDMKGGVAVAMALFEDLNRDALPYELVLVLYEREEGPHTESGLRTLLAEVPALSGIDLAIVMEPTDGVVQVGCVGSIHATLTFRGKSAHAARPWQGRNAITAAGDLLANLDRRTPMQVLVGGQTFREVMTVTRAEGGRYRNVVPDVFTLNLNYRFAPGKDLETAQQDVKDLVAGRADVTFTDLSPSGTVPSENPHFQRFIEITGRPVDAKQAWTDVARFSEAGIDGLNFGPGLTAQAHQVAEYCEVRRLAEAYRDLRRFLETSPAA